VRRKMLLSEFPYTSRRSLYSITAYLQWTLSLNYRNIHA